MTRWKLGLLLLTLAASALAGCKQQLFERECDLDHYRQNALKMGAGTNLDTDIPATNQPGNWSVPPPGTVDKPHREERKIKLQEAIAIAMEQGNTGFLTLGAGGLGQANENIQSGRSGTFSDSVRVLALDPAIAGADIEAALAKFDARWLLSNSWSKRDEATPNAIQAFQNGDQYNLSNGIFKPLPTGGVMGITFNVDYLRSDSPGFFLPFNPVYRPRLQLQFEQPLLQNYGVEINQLLVSHPGSSQIPRFRPPGGGRVEGILITRVRFEQAKADFERNINHLLLNVEAAYWNLWAAYGTLFARDQVLVEAYELWRILNARTDLEGRQHALRARAQLEGFRVARYDALGRVIESERQLRLLLGMNDDGTRLVPEDAPTYAPYEADWYAAVNEALFNRPELVQARQDLKVRQFDILLQKNQLKPDLRFFANYDMNGVGDQLDGGLFNPDGSFSNALGVMALNKFNSWQFGFLLDVPIGYRDAHSAMRVARLNLLRSYAGLRDNERKVISQLQNQYSRLAEFQRTMQSRQAQWQAAKDQLKVLKARTPIEVLAQAVEQQLNAQNVIADSQSGYFRAVADYNNTLAGCEFAMGRIMQYDNVMIGEGPLPECAQIRATEHFRERNAALVVRERSTSVDAPTGAGNIERDPLMDMLPVMNEPPPSVPEMMRSAPRPQPMGSPYGASTPLPAGTGAGPGLLPNFNSTPRLPQRPAGSSEPLPVIPGT